MTWKWGHNDAESLTPALLADQDGSASATIQTILDVHILELELARRTNWRVSGLLT